MGNPNTQPDAVAANVAKYGTDAVDLVTAAQKVINSYAIAQGGRTPETDAPSRIITDQVIPAATRLSTVLKTYAATTDVNLKTATAKQILEALNSYEATVTAAIGRDAKVPPGLANQLAASVTNIRDLIVAIRNTFGGQPTSTLQPAV
jgi:hypothetical protein